MSAFVPSSQVPLIFGGAVACGLPGDELTGPVNLPLYGSGSMSMSFTIPTQQSSIQVALCMKKMGNPGAQVLISLYGPGNSLVATSSLSSSQVPSTPGWTNFVTLAPSSPLSPGRYSVTVSSSGSNSTDYYLIYINFYGSFVDPSARASYTPPPGLYGNSGSPVVWVKDSNSNDIAVFPFGSTSQNVPAMQFTADSSYQINCLVPWLSDMEFIMPGSYTAAFVLTDTTTGTVVGTAPATQYYNSHGLMGLIPLQFPSAVSLVGGHTYTITIQETGTASATSAYPILIRGVTVNPTAASPTGFSSYWLGELALSDFSQYRVLDYPGSTITGQNGHGAIGGTDQVAVRILPNQTETITQVKLKMSNTQGATPTSGTYPAGTQVTISLYASNENYSAPQYAAPTGSPLASVTVDSSTIPLVGFFNASVSFPVSAGTPYWIVWSAPGASNSQYDCQRCVSPFRNLALASQDGGKTWSFFGQGPTDLAFAAISSQETLGSPYDATIGASLSSANLVAQPFILSQSGTVNSVFACLSGGTVVATIYPDNGSGTGPNMSAALGSGSFNTSFEYFYSGVIIPLSTPAPVQANAKNWIVFSSQSNSTINLATYWQRPTDPSVPAGYEAIISSDTGATWGSASSEVASAIFMVGTQPSGTTYTSTGSTPTTTPSPSTAVSSIPLAAALASKGITTYSLVAYGQPSLSASDVAYYLSQGFKIYPWEDGSDGYTSNLLAMYQGFSAGGGGVLGPTYGWGYVTQYYNLGRGYVAALYPNEQEYYLTGGALSPAKSYGYNGIVIDAPELVTEWLWMYSQIDANLGLQNLLGIAGWVNADHPVNYGGAAGASGGHNMNTYVRYVNSSLGLYLNDVTSAGAHKSDGSSCLLWTLVGASPTFSSSNCQPSVQMATDVQTYHHTPVQSSSFGIYMASANANLEYQLLAAVQQKTPAFARTAIPFGVLQLVPSYGSSPLEVTSSSIYDPASGKTLLGYGGNVICCPYFNFANPSDNGSNPGRSGYYEVATPATVQYFWTSVVPTFAHYPFMEADTEPSSMQAQVSASSWNHFASLYSSMPFVGGSFGFEADEIKTLVIDHYFGNLSTWSSAGAVCHLWGTDSYSSLASWNLSNFNVIVGIPNKGQDASYNADLALIESYVSGGGNLILYSNSGAPASLTGIGSTAVPISYGHPITQPYAKTDLDAALPNGYGYVNSYGAGKVITLTSGYYGDGFGVGDSANGSGTSDGLASGLAYLTLNAISWAGGQQTPAIYLPQYVRRTPWASPLTSNGQGSGSQVIIQVCGTPSGSKLTWFSNAGSADQVVQICFSSAFYGLSSPWQAYDANSKGQIASGTGDVALSFTVPAGDWKPLYFQGSSSTPSPTQASPSSNVVIIIE